MRVRLAKFVMGRMEPNSQTQRILKLKTQNRFLVSVFFVLYGLLIVFAMQTYLSLTSRLHHELTSENDTAYTNIFISSTVKPLPSGMGI